MSEKRTLLQARLVFSRSLASLLTFAVGRGYAFVIDEVRRSRLQAEWNAQHCRVFAGGKRCEQLDISHDAPHEFKPIGARQSVHLQALAADLLIMHEGAIVNDPEPYRVLGEHWKGLDPELRWGGDFKGFADLGHFSHGWSGRA